jgi:hypothetical protein
MGARAPSAEDESITTRMRQQMLRNPAMKNSYLYEKIGQFRREELVAEAAAEHRAAERKSANPGSRGFWSSVRASLSASAADSMPFLPRLVDYPTRH